MNEIICDNPKLVAARFADDFAGWVAKSSQFHVALSGGSTPQLLFSHWAQGKGNIDWDKVFFYWGDERCVPPDHVDSNFGTTRKLFLDIAKIDVPNIHRIQGEKNPVQEADRYSKLLLENLDTSTEGRPVFDLVILGLGSDGHTASIFPDQISLLTDDRVCATAKHPDSGQMRVTLTGPTILAARRIAFLITGSSKNPIYRGIVEGSDESKNWPATEFLSRPNSVVYLDQAAARSR